MLQPTRRTNQLGLSGQSLFGYGQAKKARQPSGANAPQPLANSGIPGTANAEKLIGLAQPLAGMAPTPKPGKPLATNYYQMPTTQMSQQSKPDMGIYGPVGSINRTAADEAYNSFKGPVIGKGPMVPNTSGRPSDYLQKLYNNPTTEQPKKPELDRWTDMGVSPEDYYALKDGTASPEQWDEIKKKAIQSQMDRFYGISPERQSQLDADIARDRELAANAAADAQRSLGFTGATTGDYTDRTNRQTDYYGQRRESMDAMNKRLDQGGGLQYRQASTSFGTPEQGAQAAADFRAMGAADKARQDEINAQQRAGFDAYQAQRDARDNAQREQGIDPDAARRDVNRLSGQFAAITKQGVAPGLKFVDWVQDEINSGRLSPDSDAIKIIQQNYNHRFDLTPPEQSGPSIQAPSALDLARQKAAEARDAGYAPGMTQAQRDGLDRRRQQAAAQAAYRADAAALMGQGMSPQQAHGALARQQQLQDYYNAKVMSEVGPDMARAQGALGAAQINAAADMYKTNALSDAARYDTDSLYRDKAEQRQHDALYPPQPKSGKAAQGGGAAGSKAATDPAKPTGTKSKTENPKVTDSVGSLQANKDFKRHEPSSFLAAAQHFEAQGLTPEEQGQAFSQLYEAEFDNPEVTLETISNLTQHAEKQADAKGSWKDSWGTRDRQKEETVLQQVPVFKALMTASGLSPEEIAMQVYPDRVSMGTFDPGLPDKRQRLIEALGGNPAGEE